MKQILLLSLLLILFLNIGFVQSQVFTNTNTVVLKDAGKITDCATMTVPKTQTVLVSGVGALDHTNNQLIEIEITLKTASGKQKLDEFVVYLKSPNGTCIQVAKQMGSSNLVTTNHTFKYKFRNPEQCLFNATPDYRTGLGITDHNALPNNSGFFGVFSTLHHMGDTYNGENADGNWTFFFGSTAYFKSFPDLIDVSLKFGTPLPPATLSSEGKTCATAVDWNGGPLCVTTEGKIATNLMPIMTSPCEWNSNNDNNLWVKFKPTSAQTCINLSGIKKTSSSGSVGVQSIIVTTPSNSCPTTSAGWTIVSCPTKDIYPTHVGTAQSHNHCFIADPTKTYYLVIDGNAGAKTNLYLTGISGVPVVLPITLLSFDATPSHQGVSLNWSTASERNNDFFTIFRSSDLENWEEVGTMAGEGNSSFKIDYEFTDIAPLDGISYYQLKQTDYNGENESFDPVSVEMNSNNLNNTVLVFPNPTKAGFDIQVYAKKANKAQISIHSMTGGNVIKQTTYLEKGKNVIPLKNEKLDQGVYLVKVQFEDGTNCVTKLVVE